MDEGAKVIQKKKKEKKKQYHNGTLYVPVNTKTVGSHNEMDSQCMLNALTRLQVEVGSIPRCGCSLNRSVNWFINHCHRAGSKPPHW